MFLFLYFRRDYIYFPFYTLFWLCLLIVNHIMGLYKKGAKKIVFKFQIQFNIQIFNWRISITRLSQPQTLRCMHENEPWGAKEYFILFASYNKQLQPDLSPIPCYSLAFFITYMNTHTHTHGFGNSVKFSHRHNRNENFNKIYSALYYLKFMSVCLWEGEGMRERKWKQL